MHGDVETRQRRSSASFPPSWPAREAPRRVARATARRRSAPRSSLVIPSHVLGGSLPGRRPIATVASRQPARHAGGYFEVPPGRWQLHRLPHSGTAFQNRQA